MNKFVVAFVVALCGSAALLGAQNVSLSSAQAVPLFAPVATAAAAASQQATRAGERRRREVQVNLDALGGFYGARAVQPQLELTLFPGDTHVAVLDRLETTYEGRSWIGHLQGIELSSVVLTVTRGVLAGSVVWPGGHQFSIAPGTAGTHVITELDTSQLVMPADDALVALPSRSEPTSAEPTTERADDPSFVDVLILFTPEVRHEVGSYAAVAAGIDFHVSNMNLVLSNSRVPTRLRLVGTVEVPFSLRGNCNESIASLRNTSDGNLDEVHALGDAYGADLVHLLFFPSLDCSGIAYLPTTAGQVGNGLGLSSLNQRLGSPFTHEITHNLGGLHDWYVDDSRSSAKGHVNCPAGWITQPSYSSECNARGQAVSLIPYMSNPTVQHQGQPTGVPRGTGLGCRAGNLSNPPCDADVALTVADMLPITTNYRASRFAAASFPPRNEGFDFRSQLEAKYRDTLGRPVAGSYADPEGAVVWTVEYLRYRLGQCSHEVAVDKVRRQVRNQGLPEPCGSASRGAAVFPPRNETYSFRLELEDIYRTDLRRQPSDTRVDPEGDVVWIQEYLRYRLSGCNHTDAVARTMLQVDGRGVQPTCQ
jgi:hypothetical protein